MSRLRENVNRRSVLKAGALVVAFSLAGAKVVSARVLVRDGADGDAPAAKAIGGFVRIEADGRIVLVMPSVEMGQGIYTAEAVLLAEELDVGLDQVDLVAAPPDALLYAQPLFKAQMTGGSTSIRGFWTPLRQAGATARAMLVAAAAARWSVPPETCSTDRATVRHEASGRSLSYGELAGDAAAGPTPANVPLKGAGQWKLIGQSVKRLDTPRKVNGQAVFGIDVVVPGIKIAAVTMCPVDGGRIASLDDRATMRHLGRHSDAVVAQKHAARITGLPVDKVALHNHLIGGGFGRSLQADTIEQAVRFAKQVPYPLKIIWTREQDIRHDRFRPCYLDRLAAGLDEARPTVGLDPSHHVGTVRRYFDEDGWPEGKLDKDAVDGAWDSPYAFPAIRVDWIGTIRRSS